MSNNIKFKRVAFLDVTYYPKVWCEGWDSNPQIPS